MPAPEAALLKLAVVVAQRGRVLATVVFCTMLVVSVIVCVIPVSYTGTAVILGPQPSSGAAALLSQLGSLGSLGPELLEGSGVKTPEESLLGILSSRTIADQMIQRFALRRLYGTRSMVATRRALASHTRIEATKGYLIRINVEDRSAVRSADMANGYVDLLYALNERLALTQASQRRIFLEQQVNAEREALNRAEVALKQAQEATGVIQLPAQAELSLRTVAQLRAEIVTRELQLQQLRTVATEHNEKVGEMESGIAALNAELSKAEKGAAGSETSDFFLAAGKVPAAGLQYLRITRDLRYHEALFETLSKQYELARIDEAKAPPLLQVVDRAVPLDQKTWPPRTLLVLLSGLFAAFLVIAWALVSESWAQASTRPETVEQLLRLRSAVEQWPARR
ncbi:MAG: GNVR domain-containing protein [Acidobacteriaceae bacterium]